MGSIIRKTVSLITATPFYPHWLDFRNKKKGNREMDKYFKGRVLETGCGNGEKKDEILKHNKKIKEYVATDYSSWDEEFSNQAKKINYLGSVTEILYGRSKNNQKIDVVCDAMDLPFKKNSFDTYCSFEVLEHVNEPEKLFREAHRVLKKGGHAIFTMPFLYRDHGGIEMDFQRFTRGGFHHLAEKTGFKVVHLTSHSFFGTTMAILINQYVIRKILEGSTFTKLVLFPLSPVIFFMTNSIGYIIELFDKDIRFAAAHHVVLRKI